MIDYLILLTNEVDNNINDKFNFTREISLKINSEELIKNFKIQAFLKIELFTLYFLKL